MTTVLRRLGRSFFQRFRIPQPVLLTPSTPYEGEVEVDDEEEEETVLRIAAATEQNREFLRDEIRRGHNSQTAAPTPVIRWNHAEWRPPRSESLQSPTVDLPPPRTYHDPRYLPQ